MNAKTSQGPEFGWLTRCNHCFMVVSFPPTHKVNSETVHMGHKQGRMAYGGIGDGGRCRRRLLSSFVDDVFDGGGTPLSSDVGRVAAVSLLVFNRCGRAVVRLPIPRTMTATTKRRTTTMTRRTTTTTLTTMPTMTMTTPATDQSPPRRWQHHGPLLAYCKEAGWQCAIMMVGGGGGGGGGGG